MFHVGRIYCMCKTKMAACALKIKCCALESCFSFDGSFPSRSTMGNGTVLHEMHDFLSSG